VAIAGREPEHIRPQRTHVLAIFLPYVALLRVILPYVYSISATAALRLTRQRRDGYPVWVHLLGSHGSTEAEGCTDGADAASTHSGKGP
jgi:hypothetical protein